MRCWCAILLQDSKTSSSSSVKNTFGNLGSLSVRNPAARLTQQRLDLLRIWCWTRYWLNLAPQENLVGLDASRECVVC